MKPSVSLETLEALEFILEEALDHQERRNFTTKDDHWYTISCDYCNGKTIDGNQDRFDFIHAEDCKISNNVKMLRTFVNIEKQLHTKMEKENGSS